MKRGSTPSLSPARKIIQSSSSSPDVGMSAGIVAASVAALTDGASTALKKTPVKFVRRKTAITTKGANLIERHWGIFRANFIKLFLHENNDSRGSQIYIFNHAMYGRTDLRGQ